MTARVDRRRVPAARGVRAGLVVALFAAAALPALAQRAAAPTVPPATPAAASASTEFSPSERLLFMAPHLQGLKAPTQLDYVYRKSGAMEAAFDGTVALKLKPTKTAGTYAAAVDFLPGVQRMQLPEVEEATSNPVVMYFLERNVRELNRLTKGQANFFRKRIRMAVYDGAKLEDTTVRYRGRTLPAQVVRLQPFRDDVVRERFDALADIEYVLTLAPEVPGQVAKLQTRVVAKPTMRPLAGAASATQAAAEKARPGDLWWDETLTLVGVE